MVWVGMKPQRSMANRRGQGAGRKPAGQATRGKTMQNRLRRVDDFVLRYDPALLQRLDGEFARAFFVDLGYGAEPWTTLESAARFRRLNASLPVLGVEIDPARVAAAQPYADAQTHFRLGGFNLPLHIDHHGQPETVRLIRAFNVLRQYPEQAVVDAHELLRQRILPGGLLIEGTSDPLGRLWVAHVLRRPLDPQADWQVEALVFSSNFRPAFDPAAFQAVLPKSLIHRMVAGEPIYHFFEAWKRAALLTMPLQVWGTRSWFVGAAQQLAALGYTINLRPQWLRRGFLIWQQPTT